jgi:hypothetical protein
VVVTDRLQFYENESRLKLLPRQEVRLALFFEIGYHFNFLFCRLSGGVRSGKCVFQGDNEATFFFLEE